ncbi:MAG: hypothetical protein IPI38_18860 [Gemmatimonadetes bacterium]|nr:hypothetical protein [Gemmatimonadota bacterium]MBP9199624.1 hypothetical protein [Gemmatimonadales bacterium]MBK6782220.1 hypothetical protein [Gemmatimonadota bacterium]MBK7351945.1 hypothetical protein [Gemmatimonadota bacterium]MBK7717435.1 hypothetical protein [Gemmatimonadota bacterium]
MTRSLALFLTLCLPCTLAGQDTPLPPLAFLGFEAGTRLTPAAHQVRALGGRGLRCDRSRRDRAVHECRGTVFAPGSGTAVELWLSAVDSAAGVLTLSGSITGAELEEWKRTLEGAYGVVGARVQGSQWMLQWVRQGRMLRLTWRIERGRTVASVSLIDGRVLDGWGRARAAAPAPPPAPPAAAGVSP